MSKYAKRWSREEIVDALAAEIDRRGSVPTRDEWIAEQRLPSIVTIVRHCSSWSAAIHSTGHQTHRLDFTDEELKTRLRDVALQLGHTPSRGWWERAGGRPVPRVFSLRFGSWNKAIAAAGLVPNAPGGTPQDGHLRRTDRGNARVRTMVTGGRYGAKRREPIR